MLKHRPSVCANYQGSKISEPSESSSSTSTLNVCILGCLGVSSLRGWSLELNSWSSLSFMSIHDSGSGFLNMSTGCTSIISGLVIFFFLNFFSTQSGSRLACSLAELIWIETQGQAGCLRGI